MKKFRKRLTTGQLREYRYPKPGEAGERSVVTIAPGHAPRRRYQANTSPTESRPEFGNAVKAARTRLHYTLAEVAGGAAVKMDASYVYLIECGQVPSLSVVDALAGVLGLDLNELRLLAGYAPAGFTPGELGALLRTPLIPELREALRVVGTLTPCGQRGAARRIDAFLS